MEGKVKFFNNEKGYGFVIADDGKEYFVHISALPEGVQSLSEGQVLTFDLEQGDRGPKAVNVKLGGSDDAAPAADDAPAEEADSE